MEKKWRSILLDFLHKEDSSFLDLQSSSMNFWTRLDNCSIYLKIDLFLALYLNSENLNSFVENLPLQSFDFLEDSQFIATIRTLLLHPSFLKFPKATFMMICWLKYYDDLKHKKKSSWKNIRIGDCTILEHLTALKLNPPFASQMAQCLFDFISQKTPRFFSEVEKIKSSKSSFKNRSLPPPSYSKSIEEVMQQQDVKGLLFYIHNGEIYTVENQKKVYEYLLNKGYSDTDTFFIDQLIIHQLAPLSLDDFIRLINSSALSFPVVKKLISFRYSTSVIPFVDAKAILEGIQDSDNKGLIWSFIANCFSVSESGKSYPYYLSALFQLHLGSIGVIEAYFKLLPTEQMKKDERGRLIYNMIHYFSQVKKCLGDKNALMWFGSILFHPYSFRLYTTSLDIELKKIELDGDSRLVCLLQHYASKELLSMLDIPCEPRFQVQKEIHSLLKFIDDMMVQQQDELRCFPIVLPSKNSSLMNRFA